MPFDGDDDDDLPVGGAPLPPDDRLWRHPSELGTALAAPPASADASATRLWAVAVVAGLIGSALSLGFVAASGRLSGDVVEKPVVEKVAVRPIAELSTASSSGRGVITIAKTLSPSIIRIETTGAQSTTGSGILVRDDGYVATNAHLVDAVSTVQVVMSDGTNLPGSVVGRDPMTDIAVVKIDRGNVPVAVLGSAIDLQPGQPAIAIGSPIGVGGGPSVTVGVVSAVGRHVTGLSGADLHEMVQTDAPIAEGSSGGALCDGSGAVVGMITSVSSADDPSASGVSFAIPIEIVRAVADDIIATGSARHAWLGLEGADLGTVTAQGMGLTGGARITKVSDDSPAKQAGLLPDDVITSLDGAKITSMTAFVVALRAHHPGDLLTLEVMRSNSLQTITITLGEKNHA
ncbi:MAG TPA: trypsin-like peptidase domain-containing protein [Acidimicrobiales bacterium]|nr:trypsin-like peptidase domain-containing protein [Acidimicrobiales bacterium]